MLNGPDHPSRLHALGVLPASPTCHTYFLEVMPVGPPSRGQTSQSSVSSWPEWHTTTPDRTSSRLPSGVALRRLVLCDGGMLVGLNPATMMRTFQSCRNGTDGTAEMARLEAAPSFVRHKGQAQGVADVDSLGSCRWPPCRS
jgi:hypothetical protein